MFLTVFVLVLGWTDPDADAGVEKKLIQLREMRLNTKPTDTSPSAPFKFSVILFYVFWGGIMKVYFFELYIML